MEDNDGFFVLLEAPASFEFGIDCISYETGSSFSGVSTVPPGVHFIYYSTGMGSRQGFFCITGENNLVVRSWDRSNEEMSYKNVLSEESTCNLYQSIMRGELNKRLGPYPLSQLTTWKNLTLFINSNVLNRASCGEEAMLYPGDSEEIAQLSNMNLDGNNSNSNSNSDSNSDSSKGGASNLAAGGGGTASSGSHNRRNGNGNSSSISSKSNIGFQMTPYFPDCARVAVFCDIAKFTSKLKENVNRIPDRDLRQIKLTEVHKDKSLLALTIIKEYFDDSWESLIGEFQLSFILFLFLYSAPALEQWKSWLNLLCQCENLLATNSKFASAVIRVIYEQLNFIPDDFFFDELAKENVVINSLSSLFMCLRSTASGATIDETIKESTRRLMTFANQKFGLFEHANMPISDVISSFSKKEFTKEKPNIGLSENRRDFFKRFDNNEISEDMFCLNEEDLPVIVDFIDDSFKPNSVNNADNVNSVNSVGGGNDGFEEGDDTMQEAKSIPDLASRSTQAWMEIDAHLSQNARNSFLVQSNFAASESARFNQSIDNVQPEMNFPSSAAGGGISGSGRSSDSSGMSMDNPISSSASSSGYLRSGIYEWRYPKLYECMLGSNGKEDLIMTAARILDDHGHLLQVNGSRPDGGGPDAATLKLLEELVRESQMFVEMETSKLLI